MEDIALGKEQIAAGAGKLFKIIARDRDEIFKVDPTDYNNKSHCPDPFVRRESDR